MSKRLLVLLLFITSWIATTHAAELGLTVTRVGVGGLYQLSTPIAMEVEVANFSGTALEFELVTHVTNVDAYRKQAAISDYFRLPVSVGPHETKRVAFPVLFRTGAPYYSYDKAPQIDVQAVAHDGAVLAKTTGGVDLKTARASYIVYLLCDSRPGTCGTLQQTIAGSGTEEQINKKSTQLQLLSFSHLPEHWWEYAPARYVVVGKSLSEVSAEQREGLAEFLFSGGSVIVCEDVAGEKGWLQALRQGRADGTGVPVGRGRLFRVDKVTSADLEMISNQLVSDELGRNSKFRLSGTGFETDTFLQRNSERFNFPRARWLIFWLIGYIVVVGPLSFFVLRKLRKLELGWITVTVVAIAFGACLFWLSSAKRPKLPHVDEVAIYKLDQREPLASVLYETQLSTPDRTVFRVRVPEGPVIENIPISPVESAAAELATNLTEHEGGTESTTVQLGPTMEFPVKMLRWSTTTLAWEDVVKMPGTVTLRDAVLENTTGVEFRDALYADWSTGDVYLLGKFPSGSKIDLNKQFHLRIKAVGQERQTALAESRNSLPFDLREVLIQPREEGRSFYGLANGPVLGAKTDQANAEHRAAAMFIVDMEQQ